MSALKDAKLLGKVKVVAFDEEPMVLQGIKDGVVESTIVQDPFEYGHTTIKTLYEIVTGTAKIPANKLISVPGLVITKANVEAFEKNSKTKSNRATEFCSNKTRFLALAGGGAGPGRFGPGPGEIEVHDRDAKRYGAGDAGH